jgi:hypothetical protein
MKRRNFIKTGLIWIPTLLLPRKSLAVKFPFSFWRGSATFTPANLPSVLGWWDCSALGLSNGTAVATLPDSSGQGNTFTQASSAKMVFNTAQQNGLGACTTLTNTPGRFETNAISASTKPFSLAAVLKTSASGQTNQIIFGCNGSAGLEWRFVNSTSKTELLKQTTASLGISTAALGYATWVILFLTYDSSGNVAFWLNNAADGTATNNVTFPNITTIELGWDSLDGATTSGAMVFGEAVMTGAVFSSADRLNLYNYWRSKWNV